MRKLYYISSLILLLFTTFVNGQVLVGEGLTISKGTTLSIKNQDLIITTDEIKGEGEIVISNDIPKNHEISIKKKFNSKISITTNSKIIGLKNLSESFIAKNIQSILPHKTEKEKNVFEEYELPIKYVNYEGKSFKIDDLDSMCHEENLKIESKDREIPLFFVDSLLIKATPFHIDYNIPIYSFLLNNVRFSDYAKLYEFKYLTALIKPPIV